MAQGFSQKYQIDYTNTFVSVSQTNLLRVLMALEVHFDWEIHQMDIKSVYIHRENLKEEIYMKQPPGFIKRDMKTTFFNSSNPSMDLSRLANPGTGSFTGYW